MEGYELDSYCVAFQLPKHVHSELNWVVCFYNLKNILGYLPGLKLFKISSDICQVSNFWYLFFHSKSSFLVWQACYSIRLILIFIVNHHLS